LTSDRSRSVQALRRQTVVVEEDGSDLDEPP
jgi:hypothetical protein